MLRTIRLATFALLTSTTACGGLYHHPPVPAPRDLNAEFHAFYPEHHLSGLASKYEMEHERQTVYVPVAVPQRSFTWTTCMPMPGTTMCFSSSH